ncbi:MAG: ABC transporter permease [Clostridia bacterium]|nr:ABC transporter permease [Clostridia bacterium]
MQNYVVRAIKTTASERNISAFGNNNGLNKEMLFSILIIVLSSLYFLLICTPLLSILKASGGDKALKALMHGSSMSALWLSAATTTFTTLLVFLMGTPVTFLLTENKRKTAAIALEILSNLPMVLPPAVAGIGLLLTFGRNGIIGGALRSLGIEMVFTPVAVMLAQFFVCSGFYIQVLKVGVRAVDREIFEAAYLAGAARAETFLKLIIPMLKKPIAAGLILAWTRAMGEFGATITFAGNVLGRTRTMPLQVYTLMQTDVSMAAAVSLIMFAISFVMLLVVKIWIGE